MARGRSPPGCAMSRSCSPRPVPVPEPSLALRVAHDCAVPSAALPSEYKNRRLRCCGRCQDSNRSCYRARISAAAAPASTLYCIPPCRRPCWQPRSGPSLPPIPAWSWSRPAIPAVFMQIGAGLLAAGLPIGVAHPVEILDWSYRKAGYYGETKGDTCGHPRATPCGASSPWLWRGFCYESIMQGIIWTMCHFVSLANHRPYIVIPAFRSLLMHRSRLPSRGIVRATRAIAYVAAAGYGVAIVPAAAQQKSARAKGADTLLVLAPPLVAPLAFTNVTVINVQNGKLVPDQTVSIVGNRLQAVGPSRQVEVPDSIQIVDARGKYLRPVSGTCTPRRRSRQTLVSALHRPRHHRHSGNGTAIRSAPICSACGSAKSPPERGNWPAPGRHERRSDQRQRYQHQDARRRGPGDRFAEEGRYRFSQISRRQRRAGSVFRHAARGQAERHAARRPSVALYRTSKLRTADILASSTPRKTISAGSISQAGPSRRSRRTPRSAVSRWSPPICATARG